MSIDQRRYVDIASAVAGATAVPLQKLCGRIFIDNPLIPANQEVSFYNAQSVLEYFGPGRAADFAARYFAYTSPAPVSRAKELQFAPHLVATRNAGVTGNAVAPLADIVAIGSTAAFSGVVVDPVLGSENPFTVTVDVSGETSYAGVAAKITAELTTAVAPVDVSYQSLPNGSPSFKAVATETGKTLIIDQSALSDATSLYGPGAMVDPGGAAQTMAEAFAASLDRDDSFGSAYFFEQGDLSEVVSVAELNAAQNVKFQLYIDVAPAERETYSAALINTASVGLNLKRVGDPDIAFMPMAIMAATNYNRSNATTNYMFRQSQVTLPSQVTSDQMADQYDKARINYYGETAVSGARIAFYQRGFLCGTANAPQDMSVHANEQWLKSYVAQQWFSMLLSTRGIPANLDGAARGRLVLANAIEKALDNGTILPGKTITTAQQIAITDASDDDLAWHDVQNKGYWYDVSIQEVTGPGLITEYEMQYTLIYGKGDWVRKVSGSHNLI